MSDSLLALLATPPAPPMSVDEQAVYAGGRARVRRRGRLRGGFAAATCVAVATIGWSVVPREGSTTGLRVGGSGRTANCSDVGTNLGDSGQLKVGLATFSLRVDVGTCDGTRVSTGFTETGHAESVAFGHTSLSAKQAVFTVAGTAGSAAADGQRVALVVLPPGQQVCGWAHSLRPLDNLLHSLAPPQTQAWTRGWTFVAQPLPSDARNWAWRLRTCAPDGSTATNNLAPLATDTEEPALASSRPVPVVVELSGGDLLSVGTPNRDTGAVPVTVTSPTGKVVARDTLTPDEQSRAALNDPSGGTSASFAPWHVGDHSLFVMLTNHGTTGSDASWPAIPAPRITTVRTVPVPGSTQRLAVFDVQDAAGGPATSSEAAPNMFGSFDPQ